MAIGFGIEMAGRRRDLPEVRVRAVDAAETVTFSLAGPLAPDPRHPWSNYVRGVLWSLREEGLEPCGMDLAFSGDLPQGAGLSSSAALEVSTALVARALAGFAVEGPRLARICQRAENDFVGMKCGIMDQFVSVMGAAGHALFLDCRSLEFQHVPLELGDHVVGICHSGVKHALVGSEYNVRRQQCAAGVEVLRRHAPAVAALRDADLPLLERCRGELDPVIHRRCRHVVGECARVLDSAAALRAGDLAGFGRLMNLSHDSLRDDYEVSCPEIDLLVELARATPGVLGARITGGGFGGCTVNLLARSAVEPFKTAVLEAYRARTGIAARFFVSTPADGARILTPEETS
jgi:galactokinase